jgi:hypothetical protein
MYPHVADGVLRMVVVLVIREEDPVVLGSIGGDSGALGLHFAVFAARRTGLIRALSGS